MQKISLDANKRKVLGRKVKVLRRQGIVPGNIYGKKIKSTAVEVKENQLKEVFEKVGETGLVELIVDGEKHPVLIHNLQIHPVSQQILHVDFHQVDLREKVKAQVPLEIIGEASAVKDKVGTLLTLLSEVEVEALPADLPEKIEVDVSSLSSLNQSLKVSDLKVTAKVSITTDGNLEVVKIAPLVSKEAEALAKEEAEKAAAAAAAETVPTTPSTEKGVQQGQVQVSTSEIPSQPQ